MSEIVAKRLTQKFIYFSAREPFRRVVAHDRMGGFFLTSYQGRDLTSSIK